MAHCSRHGGRIGAEWRGDLLLAAVQVEGGKYKINYKPKQKIPIADWLSTQGRFKHLKGSKSTGLLEDFQRYVDEQWSWLLEQDQASA